MHLIVQVPAPFHPELPEDPLREKVPSSGYGKVLVTPVKKEVFGCCGTCDAECAGGAGAALFHSRAA
jgi:hypothetical protein